MGSRLTDFIEENQDTINFMIAVVLLLAVVFVFSLVKIYFQQDRGEVVAEVNDQAIYRSELDSRMKSLPPQLKQTYTEEMVLDQMIQETLLLQGARELKLTVSDEKMEAQKRAFLKNNGLDEESLDQILQMQRMSEREFNQLLERKVLLDKLVGEAVNVSVSEDEARQYYEDNLDQFATPERVAVEQALIPSNMTAAEQAASDVLNQARDDWANFCSIASRYVNGTVSACGTYNITRNSGLPGGFVNASFAMEDGDSGIVETSMGYHVVHRLGSHPEGVVRYERVRRDIKARLENEEKKRKYREYIRKLREEADIRNYLMEELMRNVTRARQTPTLANTTACIGEKAVLYGARWDDQTRKQLKMFGNHSDEIRYVECSLPNSFEEQREVCDEAGVQAYPTWMVDGERHMGVQAIDRLATLADC